MIKIFKEFSIKKENSSTLQKIDQLTENAITGLLTQVRRQVCYLSTNFIEDGHFDMDRHWFSPILGKTINFCVGKVSSGM